MGLLGEISMFNLGEVKFEKGVLKQRRIKSGIGLNV